MRFKRYLTEKTFNISKDVKYVYEKGFKPLVDSLKDINQLSMKLFKTDKNKDFFIKVRENKNVPFNRIMGNELPSKEAQAASKLNPVEIYTGAFDSGNFYRSKEVRGILDDSKLSLIQLSINKQALVIALRKEIYMLPVDQVKSFLQEFVPARIKATIAHELSHWLNDTMHNFHITNLLKTAHELNNIEVLKLHKKDVNMTHFEIDAQIHGIKQLKMANKKKWDSLELKDVFFQYNSLKFMGGQIYKNYGKEIGDIWQKMVDKRMAREKLLGKNMKAFAKPADF